MVLVDEYDKPILDALEAPEVARANRDYLRGLYGVIKTSDAHIRFTFLTGVSKFSKVSLFSGLNNLIDITLDRHYSAICGYTEGDLDSVFAAELPGLDREAIRDWYNGYGWRGAEKVYNPYDVLLLFRRRGVRRVVVRDRHTDLLGEHAVRTPGCFGIARRDGGHRGAALGLRRGPHRHRGAALPDRLSDDPVGGEAGRRDAVSIGLSEPRGAPESEPESAAPSGTGCDTADHNSIRLFRLLEANDFTGMRELFHAFYASIPHEWYTNNDIARFEGYYASVFYSYFAALGLDITVEDSSSHGRLDMAVRAGGRVYLFEFKVVEQSGAGAALAQLRARGYADKYRADGEPIHLIGVEFSRETRNVTAFEVADG